jgi:hypothetical protein
MRRHAFGDVSSTSLSLFFVFESEPNHSTQPYQPMVTSKQENDGDDVHMGSDEERNSRSATPQPQPPLTEKAQGKKRARTRSTTPPPAHAHTGGPSSKPQGAGPPSKKSRTLPNPKNKGKRRDPKQRDPFHLAKKEVEEPQLKVSL